MTVPLALGRYVISATRGAGLEPSGVPGQPHYAASIIDENWDVLRGQASTVRAAVLASRNERITSSGATSRQSRAAAARVALGMLYDDFADVAPSAPDLSEGDLDDIETAIVAMLEREVPTSRSPEMEELAVLSAALLAESVADCNNPTSASVFDASADVTSIRTQLQGLIAAGAWDAAASVGAAGSAGLMGLLPGATAFVAAADRDDSQAASADRVDAAQTVRRLIQTVVLCEHVQALAAGNNIDRLDWSAAAQLPTEGEGWPRRFSIGGLRDDPADDDGDSVTVLGQLSDVTQADVTSIEGKTLTTCDVVDASGASIEAVLPWFHLDTGGAVEGASVTLSGTWHASNDELDGRAGLSIGRRSYVRDAAESFDGFIDAELRAAFESVPNGLLISAEFVAGPDGAGNPLVYDSWREGRE